MTIFLAEISGVHLFRGELEHPAHLGHERCRFPHRTGGNTFPHTGHRAGSPGQPPAFVAMLSRSAVGASDFPSPDSGGRLDYCFRSRLLPFSASPPRPTLLRVLAGWIPLLRQPRCSKLQ